MINDSGICFTATWSWRLENVKHHFFLHMHIHIQTCPCKFPVERVNSRKTWRLVKQKIVKHKTSCPLYAQILQKVRRSVKLFQARLFGSGINSHSSSLFKTAFLQLAWGPGAHRVQGSLLQAGFTQRKWRLNSNTADTFVSMVAFFWGIEKFSSRNIVRISFPAKNTSCAIRADCANDQS